MTVASTSATGLRRVRHDTAVAAVATGLVRVDRGQLRLARCINDIRVAIDVVDRLLPTGGLVAVLTSSQELVDHVAAWWNRTHPDAAYLLTGKRHHANGLLGDVLYTTSPDIIAAWVPAETAGLRVLVGRHLHAARIGEGLLKAGGWADLLIVHEAHHTAGHHTGKVAKRRAAVHDDKVLPAAARLYATAAPRVIKRADTPADPDEAALSMDEEDVFGPVLHEYPAEQAIIDGVAARLRLRIVALPHPAPGHRSPSPTPVAATDGSARDAIASQHLCAHRDAQTIEVTLAEAVTPGDPLQSVHSSPCCSDGAADSVAITVAHPAVPGSDTTIIATVTPDHQATDNGWVEILRTHKGLRHILRALRDWDPDFGRALDAARAHGPDHHRDLLRWITIQPPRSAPDETIDGLLSALVHSGAHDWWVGYGHLAAHHARTGTAIVPYAHKADGYPLGYWNNVNRTTYLRQGLALDKYNALHALGALTGSQHDLKRQLRWEHSIAAAQTFHARHGHLDVDLPGTEAPQDLRIWLSRVRSGAWPVTEAERAALDALGMLWDDRHLLRRKAIAAAFADYYETHGNLDFPHDLIVDVRGDRTRLRSWVTVFRREHRLNTLHPHVRQTLENAGFVFDPDAAWWEDLLTTARRHHELHGDLDVAPDTVHTAAGECLLTALQNCRARSRRRSFAPDRAATLNTLDPLWGTVRKPPANPPKNKPSQSPAPQLPERHVVRRPVPQPSPMPSASRAWQAGLQAAWRHRNQFGHLVPATDYRDPLTGLRLMPWLSAQRRARLTPEQIAALDALGMIWDPTATFRRLGIQHARSYHAQHGHLRVPTTAPYHGTDARGEPYNLYNALARVRSDRAKNRLHPEWQQALDDLGYDYAASSPLPGYVAELETYHAAHGDLDIAPEHPAYTSLERLNDARRRSNLPKDLQQRLDNIGYSQETRFTDWDNVFAAVLQFYNTNGHIDVPPDLRAQRPGGGQGPIIRTWLNNQRRRLRVGVTTKQQKEKLDAVGYIWDLEEAEWMETYRLARRFYRQHGHLAVTKTHVHEDRSWAPLPGWLRTQVRLRAAQQLNDERIKLLDLIDMLWAKQPGREHQWEQRLRQVNDFRRTHGHTRILAQRERTTDPRERAELKRLAAWLNDQLVYAKKGSLREDRREKLTTIGITVAMPASHGPESTSRRT